MISKFMFFIKDTEDKEKEKTKINRQESKDKSESESSKPVSYTHLTLPTILLV